MSVADSRGAGLGWRRVVSLAAVALSLAALLALGALVPSRHTAPTRQAVPSLLPSVDLTVGAAGVWSCPGPLPLGPKSAVSVSMTNPSSRPATAGVLEVQTAVSGAGSPEHALANQLSTVVIGAQSERTITLSAEALPASVSPPTTAKGHRSTPPTIFASVSVTASGAEIAVSETLTDGSGAVAAACADGSSGQAYTASGTTAGSSDTRVALFNPTAAPAVVNLSVATGSGTVEPAAYQGLPVAPRSLYVVDIARYVPLRSQVAVSAKATVGRFVLGSLATVDEEVMTNRLGPSHSYRVSGEELAVGVGCPLDRWVMPLGNVGPNESQAVQLFDPGPRPARVTLTSLLPKGKTTTLTVLVRPGQTVLAAAPVVWSGTRVDGSLTVTTAGRVGVVVEHETYLALGRGRLGLISFAPASRASAGWVLPGVQETKAYAVSVEITDPGRRPVSAMVAEIASSAGAGAAPSQLTDVTVLPGTTAVVQLRSVVASNPGQSLGLEVRAAGPVLVRENLTPADRQLLGTIEEAVPVSS